MSTKENNPLFVRLIRLRNIGGIEGTLEIPLGQITYIEGENGVGKSSVVDGLAALCGGPVLDLLNRGADDGEVYLEISDGTWFRRKITAGGGNTLTAGHPKSGAIGKAAAWLKETLSAAALSPARFLDADDSAAAEFVLRAVPMSVSLDDIEAALGPNVDTPDVDLSGHALTVLDALGKVLYNERTETNRNAKHSRSAVERLAKSIPTDIKNPEDISTEEAGVRADMESVLADLHSTRHAAEAKARADADRAIAGIAEEIEGYAAEIAKLEERLDGLRDAQSDAKSKRNALERDREDAIENARAHAGPGLSERHAELKARADAIRGEYESALKAYSAIENTRKMIAVEEELALAAELRSTVLTEAMANLDALKSSKAKELPIDGVGVDGGCLQIDGVPAHRANTARRVQVALAASAAQGGRVPFVFADDLEHLDGKTRAEVEMVCREDGIQILGARVTDDESLTVRTPGSEQNAA